MSGKKEFILTTCKYISGFLDFFSKRQLIQYSTKMSEFCGMKAFLRTFSISVFFSNLHCFEDSLRPDDQFIHMYLNYILFR